MLHDSAHFQNMINRLVPRNKNNFPPSLYNGIFHRNYMLISYGIYAGLCSKHYFIQDKKQLFNKDKFLWSNINRETTSLIRLRKLENKYCLQQLPVKTTSQPITSRNTRRNHSPKFKLTFQVYRTEWLFEFGNSWQTRLCKHCL